MQVYGNIATDPVRRVGPSQKPFYTFRLLENHGTRENPKPPTAYSVAYFCDDMDGQMLQKGMRLKVTGRVEPTTYTGADQTTKLDLRLTTNLVDIQERREGQAPAPAGAAAPAPAAPRPAQGAAENPASSRAVAGFDDMDDDIPF